MHEFVVSLAGIPIEVKPFCPEIRRFFAEYMSSEEPFFTVAPNEDDLEYEQIMYNTRNDLNGSLLHRAAPDLEVSAILRLISNRIPEYDAILFHGSVIAVNGKAYLFAAPSGTGKTTHTRLWLQQLSNAYVLNGDKPFLKVESNGRILACGNPWQGKENLGCNEIKPLKAICLLERAPENRICSITPRDASRLLLRQTHIPEGIVGVRAINVLNRISQGVQLFRLGCNMEPEAAQISIRAMCDHTCKNCV